MIFLLFGLLWKHIRSRSKDTLLINRGLCHLHGASFGVPLLFASTSHLQSDRNKTSWLFCLLLLYAIRSKIIKRIFNFFKIFLSFILFSRTTLESTPPQLLWEMMHKRWDIEENAFHQLKTYYHADHCYCHSAVEVIFLLMLIAFNMWELYLYRRLKNFRKRKITYPSHSKPKSLQRIIIA